MARKGREPKCIITVFCAIALATFLRVAVAHANVELTPLSQTALNVQPLDVATSPDGKRVFVLTGREIVVYSPPDGKITDRIRLSERFERISYASEANLLFLTSSATGSLKTVKVEPVFVVETAGRPFKGPADAPVTIAVFDDYQ
jgi:hypothetical protein